MTSTFFGLEIGRRALQTQQTALNVTGHNVANANTEGYSRQLVNMEATTPMYYPGYNKPIGAGQLGTGVSVQEIKRVRDSFVDAQVRKESSPAGEWETRSETLQKLEAIINEPSDTGIRTLLSKFWESLQTLTTRPEDKSVRAEVRQRGIDLATTFNQIDRSLSDLQKDLDKSIQVKVDEINNIATQISSLNGEIVTIEASGDHANDLRDKRDLLIDQLSKIVKLDVTEGSTGAATVSVGGYPLVIGLQANQMVALQTPPDGFSSIQWSDGSAVNLGSGELKGLFYSRDNIVEGFLNNINDLAAQFMTLFNQQHQLGFGLDSGTGRAFFTGTGASDIAVDPAMDNLDYIAAAAGPLTGVPPAIAEGDNGNALLLVQLKHDTTAMGSTTFDDYYRGVVAQVGVDTEAAGRMVENQNLMLEQLDNQKQLASGVSLDEEMANMIKYQQAYGAAARVVTSVDEILDTIINRLGVVGR